MRKPAIIVQSGIGGAASRKGGVGVRVLSLSSKLFTCLSGLGRLSERRRVIDRRESGRASSLSGNAVMTEPGMAEGGGVGLVVRNNGWTRD